MNIERQYHGLIKTGFVLVRNHLRNTEMTNGYVVTNIANVGTFYTIFLVFLIRSLG